MRCCKQYSVKGTNLPYILYKRWVKVGRIYEINEIGHPLYFVYMFIKSYYHILISSRNRTS